MLDQILAGDEPAGGRTQQPTTSTAMDTGNASDNGPADAPLPDDSSDDNDDDDDDNMDTTAGRSNRKRPNDQPLATAAQRPRLALPPSGGGARVRRAADATNGTQLHSTV